MVRGDIEDLGREGSINTGKQRFHRRRAASLVGCPNPQSEREANEWAARQLLTVDMVEAAGYEYEGGRRVLSQLSSVLPRHFSVFG